MSDPTPCGCKLIGTWEPSKGDFGIDMYGKHWFWDGKQWFDEEGKPAKTFEQWLGFEEKADASSK